MGLDMYLYAKKHNGRYIGRGTFEYPEELKEFEKLMGDMVSKMVTTTTTYEIGYWRKFNALHHFIVSNFADEDNCQEIYLSRENVELVLTTLKEVEKSFEKATIKHQGEDYIVYDNPVAKELLPTKDGVFFGSLEYDSDYLNDVGFSIIIFEMALELLKSNSNYEISYRASW